MKDKATFFSLKRSSWRKGFLAKLITSVSHNSVLVYLYLLSGPRSNMVGIYQINYESIAKDLNMAREVVEAVMSELIAVGVICYDEEEFYVWVVDAGLQSYRTPNEKQLIGLFNLLDRLEHDECAPFVDKARRGVEDAFLKPNKISSLSNVSQLTG